MSNIRLITPILLTIAFVGQVNCHSMTCAADPQEPTSKSFALADAPDIKVDEKTRSRIDQVISELKRNYGGTLVTASNPDPVLDSPEFVAYDARLYVWPKTKMIDGSIGMLRVAELIDEFQYNRFVKQGVERLAEDKNDVSSKKKIVSQSTEDNSAIVASR